MSNITALFFFFFQDSENLDLLFQAAIDLSTSTKPYDCVTASYLLNFLVYHKELQHICLGKWLEPNPQVDENTTVSTVEKNTLAGKIGRKSLFIFIGSLLLFHKAFGRRLIKWEMHISNRVLSILYFAFKKPSSLVRS